MDEGHYGQAKRAESTTAEWIQSRLHRMVSELLWSTYSDKLPMTRGRKTVIDSFRLL